MLTSQFKFQCEQEWFNMRVLSYTYSLESLCRDERFSMQDILLFCIYKCVRFEANPKLQICDIWLSYRYRTVRFLHIDRSSYKLKRGTIINYSKVCNQFLFLMILKQVSYAHQCCNYLSKKTQYRNILLHFKMTFFCFNTFWNVIYSCDGKAEFLTAIALVLSATWSLRNHSYSLVVL